MDLLPLGEALGQYLLELRRKHFESLVKNAVPWRDDIPFQEELCIQAATYRPERLFDVPPVAGTQKVMTPSECVTSPDGRFVYCNRVLPRGSGLSIRQGQRRGWVYFDGDVIVPILSERLPDKGERHLRIWMSLTPAEVFTLRPGVRIARGKVVVSGLGLGWLLHKVCQKKNVTEVTVVEQSQSLLDWLGPVLREKYPVLAKVTNWVCADALKWVRKHNNDQTSYLFDVWPCYRDAKDDKEFQALKPRLKRVWAWGDVGD